MTGSPPTLEPDIVAVIGGRIAMILGISGSLRARSTNSALLGEVARVAAAAEIPFAVWSRLALVPPFDEDLEEPAPDVVTELRRRVRDSAGLVIATPEYNGSIPGQLKNALDWLSRPDGDHALVAKPVTVISASPSGYGAAWAREVTETVLGNLGARVIAGGWGLPQAHEAFDGDGRLRRAADRADLASALRDLLLARHPDSARERALVTSAGPS